MVDNFKIFPREFKPDEFYFIQVIVRWKDHPGKVGYNGWNHARTIRDYSLYNEEQLVRYEREIKEICDMYWARCYMRPARRNKFKIAAMMIQMLWEYLYKHVHLLQSIYSKAVGQDIWTERLWIVDIDTKDENYLRKVIHTINKQEPFYSVNYVLPTYSWYHIITKPFNLASFKEIEEYKDIDIHKNNPTLLYYNPTHD